MFFLLSGFLMLHAYGKWFTQKVELGSFLKFMKLRLARVYPLHLFLLLSLFGWMLFYHSQQDITSAPAYFQNIFDRFDQFCTVSNELVTTPRISTVDPSRHRKHFAILFCCKSSAD